MNDDFYKKKYPINKDFLSVDLWLLYGSFAWGIDCNIQKYNEQSIWLIPITENEKDKEYSLNFLEQVIEKPKGLIKAEIRIFFAENLEILPQNFPINLPIKLYTDFSPQFETVYSTECLLFKYLSGKTDFDYRAWQWLCHNIIGV